MIETGAKSPIPDVIQLDSPLTLSLSRKGRGNVGVTVQLRNETRSAQRGNNPLPAISACGYGHFSWQARQGELARERVAAKRPGEGVSHG
jgi:hypothetical protein